MENIKIVANGVYLPNSMITNSYLAEKFNITENYIYQRSGINTRYFSEENIEILAINATKDLLNKSEIDKDKIDMIIVASTSTNKLMPGISYLIQKELNIKKCICLDILAGCSGYINAFDISRLYIATGKVKYALIIGVDVLSQYTEDTDLSTRIILADGAGATLLTKSEETKKYKSLIESDGINGEILTCTSDKKIYMDGASIYKYAVTDTVRNIKELLQEEGEDIENIKYIIPHQSNIKIVRSITKRLGIEEEKVFTNIEKFGNTFCASIPIALNEMFEKKLIKQKDKIILLGYGGGLNLGSILMEV